jgi:hypothetical protein
LDEPLGHELLREAWTNRNANPRSCIVLAVAAAEVGFKQFASKTFPDAAWILENVQSPPLVKRLTELFPWSKLKVQINGKDLTPPDSVTTTLTKAVRLRNDIDHGRGENLSGKTVDSVLTAVRDLLYFLDVVHGQQWANLSPQRRGSQTFHTDYLVATAPHAGRRLGRISAREVERPSALSA